MVLRSAFAIGLIFGQRLAIPVDHILKLQHTLDALFGNGVSRHMPKDVEMTFSRKTGRIRTVTSKGRLLCTLRIDGGLALSPHFAQMLLDGSRAFQDNCVEVNSEAAPFVEEGRSAFCRHVVRCGKRVRVSADTPIVFEGKVIAVGKAVLAYPMIGDFKRGVAVRIRNSLKSSAVKE